MQAEYPSEQEEKISNAEPFLLCIVSDQQFSVRVIHAENPPN